MRSCRPILSFFVVVVLTPLFTCGLAIFTTVAAQDSPQQPAAEASTEPAAEASTEPAAEALTEPAAETPTEPAAEMLTEPAAEMATEPLEDVASPTTESVSDVGDPVGETDAARQAVLGEGLVQFSFTGVPWRDVVSWIADEANLALHVGDLPPGSFTYTDPGVFTHQEAIDRINLFLLSEGYSLVRSGQLLSVINLGDPRSLQQLDILANTITLDALDQAPPYEVVKCFFPLGEIEADEAVQEISALNLMTNPTVLGKTNQLMIVDTAAKLRSVKAVLDSFAPQTAMTDGTVVKSFSLQHVDAEDVLTVARPHIGLATGEMIGIDVSISADIAGKNLFVTGLEDKVALIEGIVKSLDQPQQSMAAVAGEMELKSHTIEGGNVDTVYNVLQTLLAGKTVRLSKDQTAGTIVALASPETQAEIAATVDQLKASGAEFEAIQLKTVDPYFAITLIEQMLDLRDPLEYDDDDDDEDRLDRPKIDADPGSMRLFVRAKPYEIEQIKRIVDGLEATAQTADAGDTRIFPLSGENAAVTLEAATKFWRGENPVIVYPSTDSARQAVVERIPGAPTNDPNHTPATAPLRNPPVQDQLDPNPPRDNAPSKAGPGNTAPRRGTPLDPAPAELETTKSYPAHPAGMQLVSARDSDEAAVIRCQLTPGGLLMQSDDTAALDKFESHLQKILGSTRSPAGSPPVVFYLQYTKPDDALRMLRELLDGADAVNEALPGTLVKGMVSARSSSSPLSMVLSSEGTTTMMSGTMTIVADTRLNRLIAQGTPEDIALVEGYLKIIDKDRSLADIQTYGNSVVIELENTRAAEVAEAVREAYANRIETKDSGRGGGDDRGGRDDGNRDNSDRGDSRRPTLRTNVPPPPKNLEPKMTVAVHEPSNSLIVTAPEGLLAEVQQLCKVIDARSEQTIEVVVPSNGEVMGVVMQRLILGEEAVSSSRSSSDRSSSDRSRSGRDSSRGRDDR